MRTVWKSAVLAGAFTIAVATLAVSTARVVRAAGAAVSAVADIVDAGNKLTLVDQPAAITAARVQHVAGDRSFWIGDSAQHRVLVVVDGLSLDKAVSGGPLHDGDSVDVHGTVKRVPGTKGQVKVTDWGRLDDKDADALSERDVYIYANHVSHHTT